MPKLQAKVSPTGSDRKSVLADLLQFDPADSALSAGNHPINAHQPAPEGDKENQPSRRRKLKSGLNSNVLPSSSDSDSDDRFDLDRVIQSEALEEQRRRKTGKWRLKDSTGPASTSEWADIVDTHRKVSSTTPLKEMEGGDDLIQQSPNGGRLLFCSKSPSQTTPSTRTPHRPSFIQGESRVQSSAVGGGISALHRSIATRNIENARRLDAVVSTPPSCSSSLVLDSQVELSDRAARARNRAASAAEGKGLTPRSRVIRQRNAYENQLKRLRDDASDSDEEDFVEIQASDSSDSDDDGGRCKVGGESYKGYFQDLKDAGSVKTSDNTLDQLEPLEFDEYQQLLERAPLKNVVERQALLQFYAADFDQWLFEMDNGMNLLFYGFGSKRALLNDFAMTRVSTGMGRLVVINGFFPALNYRDILSSILSELVHHKGAQGLVYSQTNLICQHYSNVDLEQRDHLYLLIHNIDGAQLRSEKVQASLAKLAACHGIHIIASVDHINAFVMWNSRLSSQFSFIYHDVTTFASYDVETGDETYSGWMSKFLRGNGANAAGGTSIRGALFVLNSLTSNARKLFKLLANYQLSVRPLLEDQEGGFLEQAMPRSMLFQKCRQEFIVSSDANFKIQMREFIDHQLIQSHTSVDSTEMLFIPLKPAAIAQILEQIQDY